MDNLTLAQIAIDYVKNTARIRQSNLPEGINRTQGEKAATNAAIDASRKTARQQFEVANANGKFPDIMLTTGVAEAAVRASVSKNLRVGNCHEQSSIVFDWLRSKGNRGIGIFKLPDHNHAFVVIGLTQQPPKNDSFIVRAGPPAGWNAEAVVCDPWYHEWFVASQDWNRKIGYIIQAATNAMPANGDSIRIERLAYI